MSADDTWPPRAPAVGVWLIVVCVFVYAMVLVGGATRLTDSGLSITEWNVMRHFIPPLNDARWHEEFSLYQRTMEYQAQNNGMSLEEFKHIFWWEWAHRFLGQLLGLVFLLPALVFLFTGRLRGRFRVTLLLFVLGGLQGAIGWWMVTSGLWQRLDVSPFRLAVHLAMAFTILAIALWTAMGAFTWPRERSQSGAPRWTPFALMALVFAQIMFGALLAGSHGGRAYADWPTIGHEWIPSSAFTLEPFWTNFTQEHATQQLIHRSLGYVVGLTALALAFAALIRGQGPARNAALAVGAIALLQVGLGIQTVISASPLSLSLMHQAGAALLWCGALVSARASWR
jgi:cytochrome c oxidase assembly protein subunit 15